MSIKLNLKSVLLIIAIAVLLFLVFGSGCGKDTPKPAVKEVKAHLKTVDDTVSRHNLDSLKIIVKKQDADRSQAQKEKQTMQFQINRSRSTIAKLMSVQEMYKQTADTQAIARNSDSIVSATKDYISQEQEQQANYEKIDSSTTAQLSTRDTLIAAQTRQITADSLAAHAIAGKFFEQNKVVMMVTRQVKWLRILTRGLAGAIIIAIIKIFVLK